MLAKIVALISGVVVLAGCAVNYPQFGSSNSGGQATHYHVAVIGDSFTTGSGEGGVGPDGWPTLVKATLSAQKIDVDFDLAPEGGAGYVAPGYFGGVFGDQVSTVVGVADDL